VTYSRNNQIEEYVSLVLKSIKQCGIDIYCICNYPHIESGLEYVTPYAEKVICRENRGYDSGAYRDAIIDLIGLDRVLGYDELLLVNDSFWGMFFPLENYINEMDGADCDFWGMTGQAAGEFQNPEYKFDAHVHSYFMVFKSNVLHSDVFRKFWEDFEYATTFREAVVNFEIGINARLRESGFKGMSFIDLWKIELERNINPYYEYPYELISGKKFPLLKKKCILIRNHGFPSLLKAVKYLKENLLYPTGWIEDKIETQFYIPEMNTQECNSLEAFYHSHSNIYIYGKGVCGRNLAVYFGYKGWNFENFIVSDKVAGDSGVISIDEAAISPGTGIIVSVINESVASDIVALIGNRCLRGQLFLISECRAIQLPR
jgi:rhamnosyltransferase